MRGQGSTEYLVIFAAVLVVSLIVIYIVGETSKYHDETKTSKDDAYWANKKPLSVLDRYVRQNTLGPGTTYHNFYVVLKNKDLRPLYIERITIYPFGRNTAKTATIQVMKEVGIGQLFGTYAYSPSPYELCGGSTGEIVEISEIEIKYRISGESGSSSTLVESDGPILFTCK